MSRYDAILLIAFGGPESRDEIRPFLERVTAGRGIPPARLETVAHHYELIGGRSPLNELTRRQADALRRMLARDGIPIPVYVGMRNWHPFLDETLAELAADGCGRVLGIILSAFQAEASWSRYISGVESAREAMTGPAPVVDYAESWSHDPLFIQAVADRVAATIEGMPHALRNAPLVFTAHSIPRSMADDSPYADQFRDASQAVAERLGRTNWSLAYQSRSGNPRDPWLEPDVSERDRAVGGSRREGGHGGTHRFRFRPRGGPLRSRCRGPATGSRVGNALLPGARRERPPLVHPDARRPRLRGLIPKPYSIPRPY